MSTGERTMLERLIEVMETEVNPNGLDWAEATVRALLAELREPSEEMLAPVRAFYEPHFDRNPEFVDGWVSSAADNLRLMIDAILSAPHSNRRAGGG